VPPRAGDPIRVYNLLELYDEAGALTSLYVHVASPARLLGGELHYTDHELDVVRKWGAAPFTTDADELEQALSGHDSAAELRAACYRAVAEVTDLLGAWSPRGPFAPATSRDSSGGTSVLELGTREPGRAYVVRPGAYAVIADARGRVGVMRTPTGFHLPGGGMDAGETPEAALAREVREECGRGIVAGPRIERRSSTCTRSVKASSQNTVNSFAHGLPAMSRSRWKPITFFASSRQAKPALS